jgi:hypothetical protein
MSQLPDALLQRPDLWLLLLLPVCAAMLGGLGNWLALRLLFGPLPLHGVRRQGIIGEHAVAVADRLGAALMQHLSLSELFRLMEPEKIAGHLSESVMGRLEDYVDDIMTEKYAVLWDNLPELVRRRVYGRVRRQLPSILDSMVDDMAENIDQLVDVHALVAELLGRDPALLTGLFDEALQQERRFLIRSGFLIGLLLGVVEAGIWFLSPKPWILPVAGVAIMVGCFWLPRQLLFYLAEPRRLGGLFRQGWIYHHQSAVMGILARHLTEDVLSLRVLMRSLLSGSRATRTRAMIKRHMRPLLDAGMVRTTIQLLLGAEGYVHIKQQVIDRAVQMTMGSLSEADFNHDRAGPVQDVCTQRLVALDAATFRALVEPLLDEGAWMQVLVLIGLGAGAGLAQWAALSLL